VLPGAVEAPAPFVPELKAGGAADTAADGELFEPQAARTA